MHHSRPNYDYWKEHGEWWREEYPRRMLSNPLFSLQTVVLSAMFSNEAGRIAEFGCGVGRHLQYLRNIVELDVYGLDQSQTMLSAIKSWADKDWFASHVALVDATGDLPYEDAYFDIVFTCEVLVHVHPQDLLGRLAELVRVSKRGVFHLEPAPGYKIYEDAHEGSWNHDLLGAYAELGIDAMALDAPIVEQHPVYVSRDGQWRPKISNVFLRQCAKVQGVFSSRASDSSEWPRRVPEAMVARVGMCDYADPAMVEAAFKALPSSFRERVDYRTRELEWFIDRKVLTRELLQTENVIDWEAGDCAFSVAMLRMGAKRVFAIDTWLDEVRLLPMLGQFPGLCIHRTNIHDFAAIVTAARVSIDFVFSNTVTEHICDLVEALKYVRRVLRLNGYFFTNHDNYYQPVGSHDHGFLFYGPDLSIVPQGVSCWSSDTKCSTSEEHRQQIRSQFAWTWDDRLDASRNPTCCKACYYYKRSQPWAHLLFADEFRRLFPSDAFRTDRRNGSLNKVTTFQLQQFIREVGFDIRQVSSVQCRNEPPPALLGAPYFFNRDELKTCTIAVLAQAE